AENVNEFMLAFLSLAARSGPPRTKRLSPRKHGRHGGVHGGTRERGWLASNAFFRVLLRALRASVVRKPEYRCEPRREQGTTSARSCSRQSRRRGSFLAPVRRSDQWLS